MLTLMVGLGSIRGQAIDMQSPSRQAMRPWHALHLPVQSAP
jgi:hypothetical protein